MLNCRQVAEQASEYLEKELSLAARLQMRLHLLMCRVCRQYVRQLLMTRAALRAFSHDDQLQPDAPRELFRRWTADERD